MKTKNTSLFVLSKIICALIMTVLLAFCISAAEAEYYYVNSETGTLNALATKDSPTKFFTDACEMAAESGVKNAVIVITNAYDFPNTVKEVSHEGVKLTITSNDGETDYRKNGAKLNFSGKTLRYYLAGDTTFKDIDIEYNETVNFTAGYNPITFDTGVTLSNTAGEECGVYVVGGYQAPTDAVDTTKDSHITIRSGSFLQVVGGSRDKADGISGTTYKICTFTGTHYIDISGGEIDRFYGASARTHYSHSANIKVSGGKIGTANIAGDLSRRLNGDAVAEFSGGEIGTLNVNNIIGKGDITICGAKIGSISVSCYNSEVTTLEEKANKPKTLYYDATLYSAEEIEKFAVGFDATLNIARIYVKAGANGNGKDEANPMGFAEGFENAARTGSSLFVIGKIELNGFSEPTHAKAVEIFGATEDAELVLSGKYTLGGETKFDSVKISGSGSFVSNGAALYMLENVKTDGNLVLEGSAYLYGGKYKAVLNAERVFVFGGEVLEISGSKDTFIEVAGGKAGTVKSAAASSFELIVSGGEVDKVEISGVSEELILRLVGGKVGTFATSGENVKGTLYMDEKAYSPGDLGEAAKLFEKDSAKVYYICDGGEGSGASFASAGGSLKDAYAYFGESDGTVVVCGKYTVPNSAFKDVKNSGKVTVTSLYDGVDYRETNDAEIVFYGNFYCGGETEFNNIVLNDAVTYLSIFANNEKLLLGENISCTVSGASTTYLSVMGGGRDKSEGGASALTIKSGTWQRVRGGAAAGGSTAYTVNLKIYGGTFIERLTLGSAGAFDGVINTAIYGGEFRQGIFAATLSSASQKLSADVNLDIYGGTFYSEISPAADKIGVYSGSFDVNIYGGEFAHLVDLKGAAELSGGMTSSVISKVDLNSEEKGTMTFKNPLRKDGADPWLFYHDGFYYYTRTGNTPDLKLIKVANIGDLPYANGTTIYKPKEGERYSSSTWSPEIHYYTDEEIGEGNGGWYCYIAGDDHTNAAVSSHRMYVIKCLDGDNLLGRWGNPLTGEVNVPLEVTAPDIPNFHDTWAAGQTSIRIDGKLYTMYVTVVDDGGGKKHQTINIVEMTNPWTINGGSTVICEPEYDWEIGNHKNLYIVECGTPVYAEDGSIHIVYSACGYSTPEYKLGQLKYLGGDPTDKANWQKAPEPILSRSDEVNGCGSASYVTDTSGQGWICYNAYTGVDTSGLRYAFAEPYTADANGVVIGDGRRHPAPLDTEQTAALNPLPLMKKISDFDRVENTENRFKPVREYADSFTDVTASHWFYSYVKDAYGIGLVNGTSTTKFSPDGTFTVAQALTAAANIHSIYSGKVIDKATGGTWYKPYADYCVANGIIKEDAFKDYDAPITRGDMAIVFANVLPASEYTAIREGSIPDVNESMACFSAVQKLYNAGIIGGDAGSGRYRPNDSLKRSEACVIFTRIALRDMRIK